MELWQEFISCPMLQDRSEARLLQSMPHVPQFVLAPGTHARRVGQGLFLWQVCLAIKAFPASLWLVFLRQMHAKSFLPGEQHAPLGRNHGCHTLQARNCMLYASLRQDHNHVSQIAWATWLTLLTWPIMQWRTSFDCQSRISLWGIEASRACNTSWML